MSIRRLVTTAGGLAVALAAPMTALHSQTTARQDSASHRTWGVNPGPVPTTAPTTTTTTPATAAQARSDALADTAFIRGATSGNLLEVRLGTLAAQKATNPAVKQFAQRMVTDHTTMGNQWAALVARNGLPANTNLNATQQQAASQLAGLSGAQFDQAYMSAMIQDHQQDVSAFQSLGPSAHSADVRQLAASSLVTLQQHLSLAQQVGSQVGSTTNVAVTPQYPQAPSQPGQATTQPGQVARVPAPDRNDLRADRDFVQEVTADHVMEVRLAEMAQQKSTNADVKRFAERIVTNFTRWQNRWTGMASRNGMPFQPGMGKLHREKVDRLQKASGAQFDRVYLSIVTENIQSLLPYFQKEGRSAHSPQVRNLVEEELPALQQQLELTRGLTGQVRADAKVSGRARSLSNKDKK